MMFNSSKRLNIGFSSLIFNFKIISQLILYLIMKTINEHINYWLDSSEQDLKVADVLFENKKYDWCLFIGHLVLEKAFKAIYINVNEDLYPPKIHNLLKLSELCNIELNNEQTLFLDKVNNFNIEARYPAYKNEFHKMADSEFTVEHYNKIKEYYQWLKSLIK